ncbi:ParB/Srx family N-terminal domain-containing protein [Flavonifractor plautii]|uniref:ParB/Srx family N-terminal domain-containing protein n=1 Tax=Flavonifractor plautii TaxID=292800 RepID=A0AAW6BXQ8_FLAPL|nr:ParB/Srx family N-terminal domain-containing protein [Flavonifractor plautii]MDB7887458.1 ParB/Srx family N-terminal domain-containing protein [Flavonifractor plautii]MDB7905201.1 ParB/Srx family N-terminal domain-containing protein [Flavonifractor plautii]
MQDNKRAKGEAGGIPVFCAFDKIVPVGEVKPNPKNPNQHPEEQIDLLAKIIRAQGWRAPVTVSTLSGLVVRGHGRLMAAIHAGLSHVPVDYQHYDSEEAETADLIADNRIAELAEIDNKMLAELFGGFDAEAIDVSLTGYTADDVADITAALQESVMADIDEVKSKSEAALHKLRFDSTEIPMTDTEYEQLKEVLDSYVDENGVVFGFVGWLLND